MEIESIRQQLAWIKQHIRQTEYHIARLLELIYFLEQSGQDTKEASESLRAEERRHDELNGDKSRLEAIVVLYEQDDDE